MAHNSWDDLGEEIKDAVNDAVSSGDFADLGRSIGDLVNSTLYVVGKGVTDSVRQASRMASEAAYRQASATQKTQVVPLYNRHPSGRGAGIAMMAIGFPLMGVGLVCAIIFALCTVFAGSYFLAPLILFLLIAMGGLAMGIAGNRKYGLIDRFQKYTYRIEQHAYIAVSELASRTGKSIDYTMKDLQKMINEHLFYQAHLDWDNHYLILSDRTYEQYQMARADYQKEQAAKAQAEEEKRQQAASVEQLPEECRRLIEEGQRYVAHIRACNDAIPGEEISQKLDKMEQLVQRIFDEVKEHPEVAPDLHKMMEYYLPTTAKLLDAYRELDEQPIAGDNVSKTKKEIEDAVDSLNVAFEKLLDSLFEDRAWDISSDISVLNTMLAQEGLKERDFDKVQ